MRRLHFKVKSSVKTSNLLMLGTISILFNVVTVGFFDLIDIFILLMFIITICKGYKFKRFTFYYITFLTTYLLLSSMLGTVHFGTFKVENLAFLYKWILPGITIYLLQTHFETHSALRDLKFTIKLLTIGLSSWCIAYLPLLRSGFIVGNIRASFPFTDDFAVSDAHVLSSLLAVLFIYSFDDKRSLGNLVLLLLNFIAIMFTGSRTGALLVILFLSVRLIGLIYATVRSLKVSKNLLLFSLTVALLLIASAPLITNYFASNDMASSLINRAVAINFSDESSSSRLNKLSIAWNQINEFNILTGAGLVAARLTWYDNTLGIALAHGGLLLSGGLLVVFLSIVFWYYKNQRFVLFVSLVLASQLITEHFLLSRYIIPTICCGWLIIQDIKLFSNKTL